MLVNAALMLFYSFGAIGGPTAAAFFMQSLGPHSLFSFCAGVYVVFILIIFYRMGVRRSVPQAARGRFTALLRTSTAFARLARSGDASGKG